MDLRGGFPIAAVPFFIFLFSFGDRGLARYATDLLLLS